MQTATQDLLEAIEKLPQSELDNLVMSVLQLRARRSSSSIDQSDSQLLSIINRTLPNQSRFDELVAKRQAEEISQDELEELIGLTDQAEQINVDRIRALSQLAQRRQQTLPQIMETLGIKAPECV